MKLYGAMLLVASHLIFALVPNESFSFALALGTIVILGTAFSLVPASMWPSLPKIVEDRYLGTAYGCIFWIQNIGLMLVPGLIGWSITKANPGVAEQIAAKVEGAAYNYMVPELIFAGFGVAAIILAIYLRSVDKKQGYGLELPNKKK
jgi:MFS family permease